MNPPESSAAGIKEAFQHAKGEAAPTAADLIKALNHPIRRSLLRFLLDRGPANSVEIRAAVTNYIAPTLVNHHLDELAKYGAVVRCKQPDEKAHVQCHTEAIEVDWFLTALSLTTVDDQFLVAEVIGR